MTNKQLRRVRLGDNVLRIPHKFYYYCVMLKLKVPEVVSSSSHYLWVDRTDTAALDELLLEASFMGNQCDRGLVSSANALTKAYNRDYLERNPNVLL